MRFLGLVLAAGIIIGAGLVHGAWTNRWRPNPALQQIIRQFPEVPTTIGTWTSEEVELDPREMKAAGAVGAFSRRYVDSVTGDVVSIFVILGAPGDIASHTPDICYPGAGFVLGPIEKTKVEIEGASRQADFFTSTATQNRPDSLQRLRLLWGWTTDGSWKAPDDARRAFVSAPALCKIYVVSPDEGEETDPASPRAEFLSQFLNKLGAALFGKSKVT